MSPVLGPRARARASAALELRWPARRHRRDAFLEVIGLVLRVLLRALVRDRDTDLVGEAPAQRRARRLHRDRRRDRDLGRQLDRALAHLILRDQYVGQPDAMRLLAI